jgi:hypothetical protein
VSAARVPGVQVSVYGLPPTDSPEVRVQLAAPVRAAGVAARRPASVWPNLKPESV